ncbi:MAG: hypothetical protein PHN32_06515 [Actinomycetota bacterium]|nr:hypothetical protein [Actinomycetota bacterium]
MNNSIDAKNLSCRELNSRVKKRLEDFSLLGEDIVLTNVCGQRYIGDGIQAAANIKVQGIAGNNLGAFMDGPTIEVFSNGQDGIGNTMNSGRIIIHGDAGDILGYSMRGGEIYIKHNVGYRCGIHMKSYQGKVPVIVIGGRAGNFLGEYMAGGIIIVLGLDSERVNRNPYFFYHSGAAGSYVGTGMHGGSIFIREDIPDYKLGKEVKRQDLQCSDLELLDNHIANYSHYFGLKLDITAGQFLKLAPYSHRPYGKLYAY